MYSSSRVENKYDEQLLNAIETDKQTQTHLLASKGCSFSTAKLQRIKIMHLFGKIDKNKKQNFLFFGCFAFCDRMYVEIQDISN